MRKYLSGAAYAAIAGAAMFASIGASPAQAQTPGGSYLQSCTNVHTMGNQVVATCRRADGSWNRTAINDIDSCNGGLANANGQLTCGRRHGSQYGWSRRDDEPGYGSSVDPRFERRRHEGWRHDYDYDYKYGR